MLNAIYFEISLFWPFTTAVTGCPRRDITLACRVILAVTQGCADKKDNNDVPSVLFNLV